MTIYAEAGESIYRAAERAKREIAASRYSYATLVFNGISIEVSMFSHPDDIAMIYELKLRIVKMTGVSV